jgi:hypothetical protein
VPARTDRQGIGWSIPLMNSNIYYFVLELSMQTRHPNWQSVSSFHPNFRERPPSHRHTAVTTPR